MDYFCVLTRGGVVLYSKSWTGALKGSPHPVDDLVSSVLLQDRLSLQTFNSSSYSMRWLLDNANRLVYVAVFNKFLGLPVSYTSDLLETASTAFSQMFREELASPQAFSLLRPSAVEESFGPTFTRLCNLLDKKTDFGGLAVSAGPASSASGSGLGRSSRSPAGLSSSDLFVCLLSVAFCCHGSTRGWMCFLGFREALCLARLNSFQHWCAFEQPLKGGVNRFLFAFFFMPNAVRMHFFSCTVLDWRYSPQ